MKNSHGVNNIIKGKIYGKTANVSLKKKMGECGRLDQMRTKRHDGVGKILFLDL